MNRIHCTDLFFNFVSEFCSDCQGHLPFKDNKKKPEMQSLFLTMFYDVPLPELQNKVKTIFALIFCLIFPSAEPVFPFRSA